MILRLPLLGNPFQGFLVLVRVSNLIIPHFKNIKWFFLSLITLPVRFSSPRYIFRNVSIRLSSSQNPPSPNPRTPSQHPAKCLSTKPLFVKTPTLNYNPISPISPPIPSLPFPPLITTKTRALAIWKYSTHSTT